MKDDWKNRFIRYAVEIHDDDGYLNGYLKDKKTVTNCLENARLYKCLNQAGRIGLNFLKQYCEEGGTCTFPAIEIRRIEE